MKNVLLVDDDHVANFIATRILQQTKCVGSVDSAHNGHEALQLFQHHYKENGKPPFPDLILLDINMPVMDGFGFLDGFYKMKSPQRTTVKICVVSSSINEKDIDRAKSLGVFQYLVKPLGINILAEALSDRIFPADFLRHPAH